MKKNIQRGTSNVPPLQEGNDRSDHAHVKRTTPLETKRKQIANSDDLGINSERESNTSRKRSDKDVKPL